MRNSELTELYLREAAGRGMPPGDLIDVARRETDLENLFQALTALPDRLFEGDFAAFARAVGLTEDQVTAAQRARTPTPTRLARADLYPESSGFRLMELNMGSTTGGGDNAMLNRAMLAHPVLAEFVRAHSLSYVDTMAEQVKTLMADCDLSANDGAL